MTGCRHRRRDVCFALLALLVGVPPVAAEGVTVIDIPLTGGSVPAVLRTIRVRRGNEVVLRWTSDSLLTLHLHGYDMAVGVQPGATAEMRFLAHATGRFSVEAHFGDGHRRLLYIEVHPR